MALCLLLLIGLAARAPSAAAGYPAGRHPYPRGNEWPKKLRGPFPLRSLTHVRVPSFDGVELDGWIYQPKLPGSVKAPVVLWSSPYFGQTYPAADDPALRDNSDAAEAVPIDFLVRNGYAVAVFNVRGSGNSGGCFEMFGPKEQRDQALLVEWLAKRSWSNGRVGMMGLSYHGTTPWEAAVQNPPHLKTIVVAGMIGDLYTFYHTPQGAPFTIGAGFQAVFNSLVSFAPPVMGPADRAAAELGSVQERACPEVVRTMSTLVTGTETDRRDKAFWDARRLIDRFPSVTTSVFLTHGFLDLFGSGHQAQEDEVWRTLRRAPKRMFEGQWGHSFPNHNDVRPGVVVGDWNGRLLGWLDFWLKGLGPAPPRLGAVDYQDSTTGWHTTQAWPPSNARREVLYLNSRGLSPSRAAGESAFLAAPSSFVYCAEKAARGAQKFLTFVSAPVKRNVLIAGNPFTFLRLSSNLPGGLVSAFLYDLSPDFHCEGGSSDRGTARLLTLGTADLRFHAGNLSGKAFPTGTPTGVRIDLPSVAEVLPRGHRLGVFVSGADPADRTSQPYMPAITVHAGLDATASHVVVPVVDGTLGGGPIHVAVPAAALRAALRRQVLSRRRDVVEDLRYR